MTSNETQQPPPWEAQPQDEHRWLQRMVGEWVFESDPSTPEGERMSGTERVRAIGDLWVQGEGQGSMHGGGQLTMIVTLGYDPQRGRFVGTWIGSMMTFMWVYEGELDAAKRVLTLNAEGPDMQTPSKMARYQDVVELVNDDHRTLSSRVLGEDGQWKQFMTMHFRRKR